MKDPLNTILVKVEFFGECGYMAYIDDDNYKGTIAQSKTLDGVLSELAESVKVLELYRLNSN